MNLDANSTVNLITDVIQTIWILSISYWMWNINRRMDAAQGLISEETKRKRAHTEVFKSLTDPQAIMEDMERTAQIHEIYETERNRTLPRDDQTGPPAKIFKPKVVRKTFPQRAQFRGNPPRINELDETDE